jgi:hypothetical protein
MKMIKSAVLHNVLHRGEAIGHPIYLSLVAVFGHSPYAIVAGILAFIIVLTFFIED